MVTIIVIQPTDLVTDSRAEINTNFANLKTAVEAVGTPVIGEILDVQGVGVTYTLANVPLGNIILSRGGNRQRLGASADYTIVADVITLTNALSAGELLEADYYKA